MGDGGAGIADWLRNGKGTGNILGDGRGDREGEGGSRSGRRGGQVKFRNGAARCN